jgi:hypothetical protein
VIKPNRFVRILSARGLAARLPLIDLRVPIVAVDEGVVERFKGHMLGVHHSTNILTQVPTNYSITQCYGLFKAMLLHRHLGCFCQGLTDGDSYVPRSNENLQISITVAPVMMSIRATACCPHSTNSSRRRRRNCCSHLVGRSFVDARP